MGRMGNRKARRWKIYKNQTENDKKYKRKVQQLTVGVQSYIMIKINAWI